MTTYAYIVCKVDEELATADTVAVFSSQKKAAAYALRGGYIVQCWAMNKASKIPPHRATEVRVRGPHDKLFSKAANNYLSAEGKCIEKNRAALAAMGLADERDPKLRPYVCFNATYPKKRRRK